MNEVKVWFFLPNEIELGVIEGRVFHHSGGLVCLHTVIHGQDCYAILKPEDVHGSPSDAEWAMTRYVATVGKMVSQMERKPGGLPEKEVVHRDPQRVPMLV